MDALSATAYVILGMLCNGPLSGYEIKARVDNSTRFFWAASYGQIYPELRRLSEAGLVAGTDEPTGGRKRTVYEITADGEEELKAWLRQPPETYEMREEGLLKLFFAGALRAGEAVEIVRSMRAYREAVNRTMHELREAKADELDESSYPLVVLNCGIEFTDWFVEWCRRTEEKIRAGALARESS